MSIDKALDHIKDWLDSKRSPYFGTATILWIIFNRRALFGIFNFDEKLTVDQRVEWVSNQIHSFKLPQNWTYLNNLSWTQGWEGSVIASLLLAFLVMPLGSILGALGDFIGEFGIKIASSIRQKSSPGKWIPRNIFDDLNKVNTENENIIKGLREENKKSEKVNAEILAQNLRREAEFSTAFKDKEDQIKSQDKQLREKEVQLIESRRQNEDKIKTIVKLQGDLEFVQKNIDDKVNSRLLLEKDDPEPIRLQEVKRLMSRIKVSGLIKNNVKKIWIYAKTCLVIDFLIANKYEISIDIYRKPGSWEIQLFGRNDESIQYLLGVILTNPIFTTEKLDKENNRIIWYTGTGKGNSDTVYERLSTLIKSIQNFINA